MDEFVAINQAHWNAVTPGHVTSEFYDVAVITEYHEFPFLGWQGFPHMVVGDDGWWRFPADQPKLPLMFRLVATKPVPAPHGGGPIR